MTKQTLEKLNDEQMNYCKAQSKIIDRTRKNGLKAEFEKNSGKLRGFLECMCQMKIITDTELKLLYLYFCSENRYDNE